LFQVVVVVVVVVVLKQHTKNSLVAVLGQNQPA
jgi:hypothetical protein